MPGTVDQGARATVLRHTVPPKTYSTIEIDLEPGTSCWVCPLGASEPDQRLRAFADDDGVARFAVRPTDPADQPARLAIETGSGQRQVELRFAWEPNDTHPAPRRSAPGVDRGDSRVRRGLGRDEALRLTRAEAFERGLPLPPDRASAPDSYRRWLRMVSTPMLVVEPRLVPLPEITHRRAPLARSDEVARAVEIAGVSTSAATSQNWSGYELLRHKVFHLDSLPHETMSPPFDWVSGTWFAPPVKAQNVSGVNFSSAWVGLDGDGTTDLVQAGTEHDAFLVDIPAVTHYEVATYYAWTEFLPMQPTAQVIGNLAVSVGDSIYVEVSIGDADAAPSLGGQFGRFLVDNLTTCVSTRIDTPVGTTMVPGTEAVWIVERPTVNGALPLLANYAAVVMVNAQARQTDGQQVGYLGNNLNRTMTEGDTVLSTCQSIDANTLLFLWQAAG